MFRITLLAVVALAAVALAHPHPPPPIVVVVPHKPTLGEKAAHAVGVLSDKVHAAGNAVKGALLETGHKIHVAADKARVKLANAIIPHHPVPLN